MKPTIIAVAIGALALAACAVNSRATYTCANGPDLLVNYEGEDAILTFANGRTLTLSQTDTDRPNLYAAPGTVWAVGVREARLTDGPKSYLCDQMAG